jgi:hypothetical protein
MKRVPIILNPLNHRSKPYRISISKDALETIPEETQLLFRILLSVPVNHRVSKDNGIPLTDQEKERFDLGVSVLASYNAIRRKFYERKNTFIPEPHSFVGDVKKHCLSIVDYCRRYGITDYSLYFTCLFEASNWEFCRPINACYSTNCYDIWTDRKDTVRAQMVLESDVRGQIEKDRVEESNGLKKSVYRDLFPAVEKRKSVYEKNNELELCLANISDTLGYHPKSEVCKRCKLANVCKTELNKRIAKASSGLIDILSIRNEEEKLEHIFKLVSKYHLALDLYAERL